MDLEKSFGRSEWIIPESKSEKVQVVLQESFNNLNNAIFGSDGEYLKVLKEEGVKVKKFFRTSKSIEKICDALRVVFDKYGDPDHVNISKAAEEFIQTLNISSK